MQRTAYLINVGRAEICNETALYQALAEQRIAGAALDVWYRYPAAPGPTPPATLPFHSLRNVLMTPHISGWTEGMLNSRAQLIADNIARTARGEPPLNALEICNANDEHTYGYYHRNYESEKIEFTSKKDCAKSINQPPHRIQIE